MKYLKKNGGLGSLNWKWSNLSLLGKFIGQGSFCRASTFPLNLSVDLCTMILTYANSRPHPPSPTPLTVCWPISVINWQEGLFCKISDWKLGSRAHRAPNWGCQWCRGCTACISKHCSEALWNPPPHCVPIKIHCNPHQDFWGGHGQPTKKGKAPY